MPIYDYRCKSCGYKEEFFITMSEHEEGEFICPECGEKMVQKFGRFGFVLKGPGFYKNDYGKRPQKKPNKLDFDDDPEPDWGYEKKE